MSVKGQSRHFGDVRVTSALPPKTDIHSKGRHVSKVPKAEVAAYNKSRPEAALISNPMIVDQAAINAGFDFRAKDRRRRVARWRACIQGIQTI
jgi:hypothetical protein